MINYYIVGGLVVAGAWACRKVLKYTAARIRENNRLSVLDIMASAIQGRGMPNIGIRDYPTYVQHPYAYLIETSLLDLVSGCQQIKYNAEKFACLIAHQNLYLDPPPRPEIGLILTNELHTFYSELFGIYRSQDRKSNHIHVCQKVDDNGVIYFKVELCIRGKLTASLDGEKIFNISQRRK